MLLLLFHLLGYEVQKEFKIIKFSELNQLKYKSEIPLPLTQILDAQHDYQ